MPAIVLEWRAEYSRSKMTNSSGNFRRTEGDAVYRALSSSVSIVKYFNSSKVFSLGKITYCKKKKGKQLMYRKKPKTNNVLKH